jgi:hypothetical protein
VLRQQFTEAMENLAEGFVLWNANDELVFCNSQIINGAPEQMRPHLAPGMPRKKYMELRSQCAEITDPDDKIRDWSSVDLDPGVADTMESRRGDRWIMVRG